MPAAGPYDPQMMRSLHSQMKQRGFEVVKKTTHGRTRWHFIPTSKLDHRKHYERHWSQHHDIVQRIIDDTRNLSTHQISVVAT